MSDQGKHQNNKIDYIEFPAKSVAELNATQRFYNQIFGWEHTMYGEDYADTADSGVYSGINAENPQTVTLVVVYALNLQDTYDRVVAAGGEITKDIFEFPGGKRFHFEDPAGNQLAVWSDKD